MERLATAVVIGIGALFVLWYVAGNQVMRRRGGRLAVWCKRTADLMGAKQTIQWYTFHSFKLEVQPAGAFNSASLTGLTESWDVPIIWLWNRLNWRRDMVLAQLTLKQQPLWGLELFRPRSVLAGDARHAAVQEGWPLEALDEFNVAPAGDATRDLANQLISTLAAQRGHLIRLSVRRKSPHLSLAINVPDTERWTPADLHNLLRDLEAVVVKNR